MNVAVLYVGSSLPRPLKQAERNLNERYTLDLHVGLHNCGGDYSDSSWEAVESDLALAEVVFIIHVTNTENAARISDSLNRYSRKHRAVIAMNCMPDLMKRTRLGKLDFTRLAQGSRSSKETSIRNIVRKLGNWMADSMKNRRSASGGNAIPYTKLITKLPAILRFVPRAGKLGDIKNYLYLYSYFLQPTPANIRSMMAYAIKYYVPGHSKMRIDPPETAPAMGVYHPDARSIFESFEDYEKWHRRSRGRGLDPYNTVGLLLMRPQVVSDSHRHYDLLIRCIEEEGLAVIPALSTFMDNREACRAFFVDGERSRVSQIVSLTGFSFVGGPAMHDSDAAMEFLKGLNVPLRSMVSLDIQTIESWRGTRLGLNPIQTAMQVAIPEIDGATEPFVYGGMPQRAVQPEPIEDRCRRIARRLARWNKLQTAHRADLRLALIVFCFPPNKGNIGTAAELDVFPSLIEILGRLKQDGYTVVVPDGADELREMILKEGSEGLSAVTSVAYRMGVDEYRTMCPYVDDVEREWGKAPGRINSNGRELLINGIHLGNVFVGVQPTFGYEGDPMRLLMSEGETPHHGFMALYTYLERIFRADVVIHVGTHGALEFMPGKQAGLSSSCWPDRLIGELPNVYIYSVNNPSEGTIAKRRSYAELVSYLTPPVESAGLYKGLASLKELLLAYRQSSDPREREQLFEAIEAQAESLKLAH